MAFWMMAFTCFTSLRTLLDDSTVPGRGRTAFGPRFGSRTNRGAFFRAAFQRSSNPASISSKYVSFNMAHELRTMLRTRAKLFGYSDSYHFRDAPSARAPDV